MKTLELESFGVYSLNQKDLVETEGGIIPLLLIGAALLLGGCATTRKVMDITHDPECSDTTHAHTKQDSTVHR